MSTNRRCNPKPFVVEIGDNGGYKVDILCGNTDCPAPMRQKCGEAWKICEAVRINGGIFAGSTPNETREAARANGKWLVEDWKEKCEL